jgi:MSHA pilin protein MshA
LLSAVAIPRFITLREEAIIATMEGLQTAINSASTLPYAKAMIARIQDNPTAPINVNGITVDLIYVFPAGTSTGISQLLSTPTGDWKQRASSHSGAWIYWHGIINEDAGSAGCYVRYRQAKAAGSRPVIDLVKCGCDTAQ